MIIRKYQAETENEAILKAKEDLGGNAVVMNMKTVKPKGIMRLFKKAHVEVTAALDEDKITLNQIQPESAAERTEPQPKVQAAAYNQDNPILRELERRESESRKTDLLEEKLVDIQNLLQERLANDEQKQEKEERRQVQEETELL